MSNDSELFRTREELEAGGWELDGNVFVRGDERYLPLYEAKMIHQFDHRAADVVISPSAVTRQGQPKEISDEERRDPQRSSIPRYWVGALDVNGATPSGDWPAFMGYRDITSVTNDRTVLASLIPPVGAGDKVLLVLPRFSTDALVILTGIFTSFVFDYAARQKLGGISLKFFVAKQLPAWCGELSETAPWSHSETLRQWIGSRVMQLSFTSWDLAELGAHWGMNEPVRWDPKERAEIRAELDAGFFHLYGLTRDEVDFVMDTFPIVKRKDEEAYGSCRTKNQILEGYDRLEHLSYEKH